MPAPLVSATLIVKNEERFLDGCLDSLTGFADEIIVVDTGSTDATRSIAERRGIAVQSFPWTDDFAAARNYPLGIARGQWIFYIDADERITAGGGAVRQSLQDPSQLACEVLLTPRAGATPCWTMRLWRNRPDIRFRGIIHENIWPALSEHQAVHGGAIGRAHLEMEHLGYEADNHAQKNQRNLPLLKKALEIDPERVYAWSHLASIHLEQGRPDEAVQAWQEAIKSARKRTHPASDDGLPWAGLIQYEINRPGSDAQTEANAAELLDEALSRFPEDPHFHWLQGRFLISRNRFAEAIPFFERLAHAGETGSFSRHASYDARILGGGAYENLATCNFRLQRWQEAARHYDMALAKEPQRMDLRTKLSIARGKAAGTCLAST